MVIGTGHEGGKADRAQICQLQHASPHRLLCRAWVTAPAQQGTAPQRGSTVSQHLVPIKLLISFSSATALGWFHPTHGTASSGQLELPSSLLGPPTGHPGNQLATHCSIIAGNSRGVFSGRKMFLTVSQYSSGTNEGLHLLSHIQKIKIKTLNFHKFALARKTNQTLKMCFVN